MKRYLCPICERELTVRSYCPECRKIVKNPVVYDGVLPNEDTGNYLLNHREMHPDRACVEVNQDRACETPAEKQLDARFSQTESRPYAKTIGQRSASSSTVYQQYRGGQSTAPGSQIWRSGTSGSNTYSGRTYRGSGSGASRKNGKKGRRSGCLTVIIVLWLIGFIWGIFGDVMEEINVDSLFEKEYVPDSEEYIAESVSPDSPKTDESLVAEPDASVAPGVDTDEDGYVELDYDKILAIGERCNGYWHYSLSGDLMYEELRIFAENEMGLSMTEQSDYMVNEADDPEYGGYTYYDYCRYWDWADGYFAVGSDSVTDDIHYVYAYSWNADQAIEIVLEAFSIVEDADSAKTMRTSLYQAIDQENITEGYFFDMGNSSVWFCQDSEEGYYMVEVYPVTE